MTSDSDMANRNELCGLLDMAARAEQALLCRYLYAAFSFKRTHAEGGVTYEQLEQMRRWEAAILTIARQEMEHLGLVFNLRTAIGIAPTFEMPSFPFIENIGQLSIDNTLNKFSQDTLVKFALAEMPSQLPPTSPNYIFLKKRIDGFEPGAVDALADLYDRIRTLFETLPERILFIGPPAAQFNTHDVFPGAIRGLDISKSPAYNVSLEKVCNRKSAIAVIEQIIAEGEGAKMEGGPGTHFAIFMAVLIELTEMQSKDPDFEPARPVVSNPTLKCPAPNPAVAVVSNPFARDTLALFEASYETMLLGLTRFFTFPENDQEEMSALQQAVFFPMMTTIIRPLGEVLTMLPATDSGSLDSRAGASFRAPETFTLTPHKWAAFHVLYMRYGDMETMASNLIDKIPSLPDQLPKDLITERLTFLYQQVYRSRMNLKVNYEKVPDGI